MYYGYILGGSSPVNDTFNALRDALVATELLIAISKKPRITPKLLHEETGYSYPYVKNTLRILHELKLVETPDRGAYVITDFGRTALKEVAGPPPHGGSKPE